MPDLVRVKVKSTGAEITIDRANVNDTVTVLDKPASSWRPLPPKPRKNLRSDLPAAESSKQGDASSEGTTTKSAPSGRRTAGESGTKKETS